MIAKFAKKLITQENFQFYSKFDVYHTPLSSYPYQSLQN